MLLATTHGAAAQCATPCDSWHFPPHQTSSIFKLHPLELPPAWSIEAWVMRAGPPTPHKWMFSLATPSSDNCVLLSTAALPDSEWHHIVVTSDQKTFLDGVDASNTALQNGNGGTACAVPQSSFVINVDQDAVASRLDANQASDLAVNAVAIYGVALTEEQAAERASQRCFTAHGAGWGSVWGAWYGADTASAPVDQTHQRHVTASLSLPAPGTAEKAGPSCARPPPQGPPPPHPPSPPSPPPSPPAMPRLCQARCVSWRFPGAQARATTSPSGYRRAPRPPPAPARVPQPRSEHFQPLLRCADFHAPSPHPGQTSFRFQLYPLELPKAFTIEGWVRHVGGEPRPQPSPPAPPPQHAPPPSLCGRLSPALPPLPYAVLPCLGARQTPRRAGAARTFSPWPRPPWTTASFSRPRRCPTTSHAAL